MKLQILFGFLLISSLASAKDFQFKAEKRADYQDSNKYVYDITNLTYKGYPILTLSPEDSIVNKVVWQARKDGFSKNDSEQIDLSSNALNYIPNFSQNYETLCRLLGFKANSAGSGNKIHIVEPAIVAVVHSGKISLRAIDPELVRKAGLSTITGLSCVK